MIGPFTPEFRLAVACCRFPGDQAARTAVTEAATAITAWEPFEGLVARHRVAGLANLALTNEAAIPRDVSARLARAARESAAFDLLLAAETATLQRLFDDADIPALFVKGATLGVLAYGALGIKQSWDIDLLTSPDAVGAALKIMQDAGYRLVFPEIAPGAPITRVVRFFHEVLLRNEKGVPVELHWRLSAKPHSLPGLDAHAAHQIVDVGGRPVKTLSDALLISYLIAHGQQHGWSRLKWLADLNALLARRTDAGIQTVQANAQSLGLGDSASAALLLCHRLFDLRLPLAIAESESRRRSVDRLVRVDLACMANARGGTDISDVSPTQLALVFSRMRAATGWRNLLGELAVIWTQPDVRARYPAHLDFLYHLLRIPLFLARLPLKLRRLHRMSRSDGIR